MALVRHAVAGATVAFGTTSAAGAWPAAYTPTAGDLAVIAVVTKHRTEATKPDIPAGWVEVPGIGPNPGGVTGAAADAGKVRITVIVRHLTGGDSAPTVTIASDTGVVIAVPEAYIYRADSGFGYDLAVDYVEEDTSGTSWSGVTSRTPPWDDPDELIMATGVTSDAATGVGARTLTATGITWGTTTEQFDSSTTNGDDLRVAGAVNAFTAGPATAAATFGCTLVTAGSTGNTALIRIRQSALAVNLGQASETDTALGLTPAKTVTHGLATETDSTHALSATAAAALGLAAETDTAFALAAAKTVGLGLAAETDSGLGLVAAKAATLGQASETDTAPGLTVAKAAPGLGVAAETSSPFPLAIAKTVALGIAVETDSALGLTVSSAITPRPALGSTAPTSSGTTARPYTGITARP